MLHGSVPAVIVALEDLASLLAGAAATPFAEEVLLPFLRAAVQSGQRIKISAGSSDQYSLSLVPDFSLGGRLTGRATS